MSNDNIYSLGRNIHNHNNGPEYIFPQKNHLIIQYCADMKFS